MDPRCGKSTRTASKAGTSVPKVSARSSRGAPTEPSESLGDPKATQPDAGRCGSARKSGSQQKKSAPDSKKVTQARAPGSRAKKAALRAEDPASAAAAQEQAVPAEGLEPPAVPAPSLPRAGSRRQGGARCFGEQRPPPRSTKVPSSDSLLPAASLDRREAAPGGWKLRAVLEKLRLSRPDTSAAAEVVNRVVDHLLRRLQNFESEFKGVALLRTGSYYEHVKISAPNEFDVMFKLEVPRIELEEYRNSGAYYFVKFKRNPKGNPLSQFLEGEILSASKMLSKFRKIIKEEIKNIEDADIIVERKKRGSPAVTLVIRKPEAISVDIILALESKSSWPASTQEGMPINNWLGAKVKTKLRRQPFYLVPKHAKEGNCFQDLPSFQIIYIQAKPCLSGKDCLKLMKYLLEQLKKKFENRKELDKFCSYHVKTAFFHVCTRDPDDSQWCSKDLEFRFDDCVTYFLQCLRTEQLVHYFIPRVNLFSQDQIDKTSKEFLSKQIEYERNNGFPVFDEF
ncbi:PREDICTED: cyclic GMP-AMP synthase [Propithecus coquereli]|uniref:cyclic GMP-AMP synthase n=1 Tax=Propithecus coquereli TaxID=379532 RepID=UPI00063F9804|nr:PREDICTED: cyclic GMP-AMP synthase [Propithecus coquereli]